MKKLLSVLMVVVLLVALSATAFAADGSPTPAPPVIDKDVTGEGTTSEGAKVAVETLDPEKLPENFPFDNAEKAVEAAMGSDAVEALLEELGLKPEKITGTSLLSMTLDGAEEDEDPVVVVVFYDKDGKPIAGAYFYNEDWYQITVEDGKEKGEYVLTFAPGEAEKGLEAEVTVTVTDEKNAAKK